MTHSTVTGPETGAATVGPNAILQYLPVLQENLGAAGLKNFFEAAHLDFIPDGSEMIDEGQAARFHQAVLHSFPDRAGELARGAGSATADYIIANRIPKFARAILAILPRPVAENMLCRSIAEHAWTFAGSGVFEVANQAPITFEIQNNPIVQGLRSDTAVCAWHAAVFEQLFSQLIGGGYQVIESTCCATGSGICRFEVRPTMRSSKGVEE